MTSFLYYFSIWVEAVVGVQNRTKKLLPNSVLVIHGYGVGPSSHSRPHTDMALELYHVNKDNIKYIIPSGFDSNSETTKTEGEEMAAYLIDNDVPIEKIITERQALTTPENIARSLLLLKRRGEDVSRYNFVSIHHPLYVWKTRYIWNLLGINARGIAARDSIFSRLTIRHHKELRAFLQEPFEIKKAHHRAKHISRRTITPLAKEDFLVLRQ